MKNSKTFLISLTILLSSFSFSYSQTQSNLATPKGSSVVAYITPELSSSERAYWDSYYASPSRTQIPTSGGYSSSGTFNCHGYAWSISEGGPTRWIGYYVQTDEDVYMTDGSYIQVCSETHPGKISWGSGDHTAITTGITGRWKSKWNRFPLMDHNWNDTPYGTTNLKYYVSTKITGNIDNPLCSGTRNFSVQSISGATYVWTTSSTLTITAGAGTNQITVARNGSSSGVGWVQVQISTPCSSGSATRRTNNFTVGQGVVSNPNYWLFDASSSMWQLSYNAQPGATSTYSLVSGSATLTPYINDCYVTTPGGAVISLVSTVPGCGASSPYYFYLPSSGSMLKVFPNPVSEIIYIEVGDFGDLENLPSMLNLYSEKSGNIVRSISVDEIYKLGSLKDGKIEMDVKELHKGLYFLHLVPRKGKGNKTEKMQIIIN